MPADLKTEWEKVTVRFPREWAVRIRELARSSGDSEAHVLRASVQMGLPVLWQQHEERREWVRGKIHPQGSKAKNQGKAHPLPNERKHARSTGKPVSGQRSRRS